MKFEKIPLAKPYFNDEEISNVIKVLESKWVAQGPTTNQFEKKFAKRFNAKYAVAINSATSGLHIGLKSLKISHKNEVLVSDFTFPASGNVILYCNAKPILVDVNKYSYNMDINDLMEKITPKAKAIMPVYAFGNPPKMDEIVKIAKENNLTIIEDAACAHGSKYLGKYAGTFGDLGVFSFHARKIITTGEGGMIITDDSKLYSHLLSLRSHGMNHEAWNRQQSDNFVIPTFNIIGYNYRISDILSAIGLSQLMKLDLLIKKRTELVQLYSELINDNNIPLYPQQILNDSIPNYQSYVVKSNNNKTRNQLIIGLKKQKIETTIGTYSLSSLPLFNGETPISKELYETTIALPLFNQLKDDEIHYIIQNIKRIVK